MYNNLIDNIHSRLHLFFIAGILISALGCQYAHEGSPQTQATLEKIAERDGVTVYRFIEMGDRYYIAVGKDGRTIPILKRDDNTQPTHHVDIK